MEIKVGQVRIDPNDGETIKIISEDNGYYTFECVKPVDGFFDSVGETYTDFGSKWLKDTFPVLHEMSMIEEILSRYSAEDEVDQEKQS